MRRIGLVIASMCACGGSDPVDANGTYTVNVTNRENGCGTEDWMEGESTSGIPVVIAQTGADATATIQGAAGAYVNLVLGDNQFVGTVDGRTLDLTIYGTRSWTQDGCTATLNANLVATLNGDVLAGDIHYTVNTNQNPSCGAVDGCQTRQELNGTRPPQ